MPIGIAGDTSVVDGFTGGQLTVVELRAQSVILQEIQRLLSILNAPLTSPGSEDSLTILRNDAGFELGITPLPIPGS